MAEGTITPAESKLNLGISGASGRNPFAKAGDGLRCRIQDVVMNERTQRAQQNAESTEWHDV